MALLDQLIQIYLGVQTPKFRLIYYYGALITSRNKKTAIMMSNIERVVK